MPADDLARFCCRSPARRPHGVRGAGDLSACGLFGNRDHTRLPYCSACEARSSERKGTAFPRSGSAPELAPSALQHLAEGDGIRQTERLTGVHRDAVMRPARLAGRHAHDARDEVAAFPPRGP